ncbi:hypothetical protein BS756_00725 [Staphylococcus sp. MB371]|uniref:DUF5388 domain-containing protein n=1 Tax=Mammaliicoccus sciuri TaxID=1296 RepID=UPI0009928C41|nr:DUF5388 domain-containing protein [Mammaliicoccus sciuri]OOV39540.1 hypothetical protein BS756_00725 [Staphylococcus sp. MB371]
MAKESLLNNANLDKKYDNTLINDDYKIQNLPATSLRIKGHTHSKILALKKHKLEESYNDLLDSILDEYISNLSNKDKQEIDTLIDQENNYKIKKEEARNSKK